MSGRSMERTDNSVLSIWNLKQLKILGKDLRLSPKVCVPFSLKSIFLLFFEIYYFQILCLLFLLASRVMPCVDIFSQIIFRRQEAYGFQ